MNNTTIINKILTTLTEYFGPAQSDFSKQVDLAGSSFQKKYQGQHNAKETKIIHVYNIIVKTNIDTSEQADQFINEWLNDDEYDIDGSTVYPDILNYAAMKQDANTFRTDIKLQVYYYRQRA